MMRVTAMADGNLDVREGRDVPYYVRDMVMDIARERTGGASPGE